MSHTICPCCKGRLVTNADYNVDDNQWWESYTCLVCLKTYPIECFHCVQPELCADCGQVHAIYSLVDEAPVAPKATPEQLCDAEGIPVINWDEETDNRLEDINC